MDLIGSLYLDSTTGISYRLTMYIDDFEAIWKKRFDLEKSGHECTDEDIQHIVDETPKNPRYSMFSVTGFAGSVDALPAAAQRIWQPTN